MARAAALSFVLVATVLAARVEPAAACSCAGIDPRAALARADAAFVGVLVDKRLKSPPLRSTADAAVYTFRVETAIKGRLPARIEVESAESGASCGLEAEPGVPIGLFLDRRGGVWRSSLCLQISPAELRRAARPLPAPAGSGRPAVVVGGSFAPARTIALDRNGRTLAYGLGRGESVALSVCPGGRQLAELVRDEQRLLVAVRALPRLRRVGETAVPRSLVPRTAYPTAISCRDANASELLIFAAGEARSVVVRLRHGRFEAVHRGGRALGAAVGSRYAYLNTPRSLERLDLRTRRAAIARVPRVDGFALSPDGRRLAGITDAARPGS